MIRLSLGAEPTALASRRGPALAQAQADFVANGAGRPEFNKLLTDYDNAADGPHRVKLVLWERQHKKCAWCESRVDWEKYPVEHIRPKGGAEDLDEDTKKHILSTGMAPPDLGKRWTVSSDHHYWWLAWDWDNIVFSCERCNKSGNKGNRFPLAPGSPRAATPPRSVPWPSTGPVVDLSVERPWLLNPRLEGSLADITWKPIDSSKRQEDWDWVVSGRTHLGLVTIEVLGLRFRTEDVGRLLKKLVAHWREMDKHVKAGRIQDARETWENILTNYVEQPEGEFRAACYCALQHLVPKAQRTKHNLRDPAVPEVVYTPKP